MDNIKLLSDCHTHTTFSHGTGSVLDNAEIAKQKGIEKLVISDHGLNHMAFGLKRKELENYREEIEQAKKITGVNVLMGIESNIIGYDGTIDIHDDELHLFDFIIMGYHRWVWPKGLKEFFSLIVANWFSSVFKPSKKRIERNTMAYINAVNRYKIDVISHMTHLMKVDCKRVAEVCAERGTLVELNGKRIDFTDKEVKDMLNTKCMFIVNSDAHSKDRVGDVSLGLEFAIKHNIPLDRIVNISKE